MLRRRGLRAAAAVAAALVAPGAVHGHGVPQPGAFSPMGPPPPAANSEEPLAFGQLALMPRGNVRGNTLSLLQEEAKKGRHKKDKMDPSFWMWKTTPAPPGVPGPNPQLIWVSQTAPPDDVFTTPPTWENCYGCDCLRAYDLDVVQGGSIPDKYTCFGGAPTAHVPKIKWLGAPENTGLGHTLRDQDGSECIKSRSFALTMQDLDYPYGTGQSQNTARDMLWIVNIPGDWTGIDDAAAFATHKDKPVVVVGKNQKGTLGMEPPCPSHGTHRYAFTLWALRDYLGTENNPVDPSTSFSAIMGLLEEKELARFVFYGTVHAHGYKPQSFLQQFKEWW